MAASIRDVAKKAGVSIGTVSRAFNGYADINEQTKERILEIAKELGYVPNLQARTLSSKEKPNIALIFSGLTENTQTSELDSTLMRGAYRYALSHGLEIATYAMTSALQEEKSYEQFCSEHSLAGALIFGLKTTDSYYHSLRTSALPCVTVDVRILNANDQVSFVGTDDLSAYQALAEKLIAMGHRKFVVLSGHKSATVDWARMAGLMESFKKHQISFSKDLVYETDFLTQQAQRQMTSYLEQHPNDHATAVLCFSDGIAIGAIKAIHKAGFRVPEDFSVVGFDGITAAEYFSPSITTVDQNFMEKGYTAAKLLHQMMQGKAKAQMIYAPYSIEERESIAPPKK